MGTCGIHIDSTDGMPVSIEVAFERMVKVSANRSPLVSRHIEVGVQHEGSTDVIVTVANVVNHKSKLCFVLNVDGRTFFVAEIIRPVIRPVAGG